MAEKLLLPIDQVCERLSLGRTVVYRLIQTHALKSVRVGGSRRVLLADLEEFVSRLRSETDEAGQ